MSKHPQTIGPYEILRPLGRGGMGVVFRARHVDTGVVVALKTVLLPTVGMLEGIRSTYDGPLTIATDLMVWNVTKDSITTREAVFPDRVTPPSTTDAYKKAPRSGEAKMSKFIMDGVWKGFTPPPLPEE